MSVEASNLIRSARRRAGLSQRELARRAGTSQAMVNRYEHGRVEPSLGTLAKILRACGEELELASTPAGERGRAALLTLLRERRAEATAIAARYHARRLRVFGSAARVEDTDASDIDLLVEGEPGRMTLFDLAGLRRELSELLGVTVDVATEQMLRDDVRRDALRDAVVV